ncbi:hypothetical protein WG66_013284 [Moniliophthora roreri]|nr:hypothetical protein WG66_013284 [Moniliophthora roreri]
MTFSRKLCQLLVRSHLQITLPATDSPMYKSNIDCVQHAFGQTLSSLKHGIKIQAPLHRLSCHPCSHPISINPC